LTGCYGTQVRRYEIYWSFLFISTYMLLVLVFVGSAQADTGW